MKKVLCVFFAFTFIIVSSIFSQTKESGDLIAYWKMDGNLIDELGNYDWINYGAISNNNGMFDECYEFNNGTTGQYCEAPSVSLHDEASISCWIYFYPGQLFDGGIIFKTHGSPHGDQAIFGFQTGNNEIVFYVTHNSLNSNHTHMKVSYNINTWYHLVGVFDGPNKELRVYLNNVKHVKASNGNVIYNPNTKLKMGMQKRASRSFRGKLDEIKLFDKALTDSEVQELFNPIDPPIVDLGPDQAICEGEIIFLDAGNQGSTYLWSTNDTTQTVDIVDPGTYHVLVSNEAGSDSDTIEILDQSICGDMRVELRNSLGDYITGGTLKYYDSGWKSALEVLPGVFTFNTEKEIISLKMYYEGASQQVNSISTSSNFTFTTQSVLVELRKADGTLGHDNGLVKYYASGWKVFGTTDSSGTVTKELLPVTYSFKMNYLGANQQISNHNTASNNIVTFQTTEITAELRKADGTLGHDNGIVKYYASGWKVFGTTDSSGTVVKELLPVTYSFKMNYLGANQQISNQNTTSNNIVTFQTTEITTELRKSDGTLGHDNGIVKYYASGWKDFGTTDQTGTVTKELLPVSYSFKMNYLGANQQISNHNTASNSIVTFQTSEVMVEFRNADSTLGVDGGIVTYYASGWNPFGTTGDAGLGITTKELLPVTYSFKNNYNGNTQTISSHNIASQPIVAFYDNSFKSSNIMESENEEYIKFECYPSPFKQDINILFYLNKSQYISISIYSISGELIKSISNHYMIEGRYSIGWNGMDNKGIEVKNGIYIIRFHTANVKKSIKIIKI